MPETPIPIPPNSTAKALPVAGNKDYDTIPTYLHMIKAMKEGNASLVNQAIKHAVDTHGIKTGTDLLFLARRLQGSNINDIARRSVATESNPELKRLYAMVNENPDLLDKFEYAMPTQPPIASQTDTFNKTFSKK